MKKNLLLIIICFATLLSFGQRIGSTYYSYPDRNIEIQFNDTCIFWRNQNLHIGLDSGNIYKCYRSNDTLYICGTDEFGYKQIVVSKRKYIDYIFYQPDNEKKEDYFGIIFRREGMFFKIKYWYILKISNRENQRLMLELYGRIKRLRVFNKSNDKPLTHMGDLL